MQTGLRSFAARWLGAWVNELNAATCRADALAGLLGAVLVLPQAIAFAALVGVPPAMGLATAVLPCAVAALAGSSRFVLSGPTNATSLALGAMLLPLAGPDPARLVVLAVAVTLLVGLMQLALAFARLGALANFISPTVMLGFTSGAALLIAWYALAAMLGAGGRDTPVQALQQGLSWPALAIGGLTLAVALLARKVWLRGPTPLIALAAGGLLGAWLEHRGHAALRLGTPPGAWLGWQLPAIDWALLPQLLPMALALTIIALGQAMSIGKFLATRTGERLDANRECRGQGLANLAGALTGCFVACGSLNRSLPNLEAGARTPLAGVSAALWLLGLVAVAGPLLAWIPLAGVGALLLLAAASLIDPAGWRRLWRLDRREAAVAGVTAVATLVLRLEVAVLAGVMLSLVAYLYRTARPAMRTMGFDRQRHGRPFVVLDDAGPAALPECPQLKLLRMEGSIWFGAVPHVADQLRSLRQRPPVQRHLLVMSKSMNFIDLAAADLWDDERLRRREIGGDLYFHRPRPQVLATWQATGFIGRLGADHVFADKRSAIAQIVPQLDDGICARCSVRLFEECSERPGAPLSPMI
ncbi:SulP family inorganic anion transporter [Aquabacterium sp.]|uniref:SulP family inorganic anion transporter n=1 Tax=Aquabacterium sp. TaxID=1872578 RepID=UPI002CBC2F69|nr:SulP family inorganic anion transporter [Aquabacterium sp.]HSW05435.1 SulP family inorganic anion transporter [Aquabacterium sp.]